MVIRVLPVAEVAFRGESELILIITCFKSDNNIRQNAIEIITGVGRIAASFGAIEVKVQIVDLVDIILVVGLRHQDTIFSRCNNSIDTIISSVHFNIVDLELMEAN
jgi:hypothetical protein